MAKPTFAIEETDKDISLVCDFGEGRRATLFTFALSMFDAANTVTAMRISSDSGVTGNFIGVNVYFQKSLSPQLDNQ